SVYIDPVKPVSEVGDEKYGSLCTHDYGKMHPVHRAKYLDWLATGRKDTSCSIYFPILYFFGLERRLLLGNPNLDEKKEIIK
ncbi:TerB N-terminal domain-containing protein, partial [Salmonella enterica subsp. enterica serovar Kentucky]|uniref:TerB N-terminal domain-containing protein n=1 Tax=Salmonella enterica TaxID=28901 RepID=UPI003F4BB38E